MTLIDNTVVGVSEKAQCIWKNTVLWCIL